MARPLLLAVADMKWIVIGFTLDDVVTYGNDYRLAEAAAHAWRAQGKPDGFEIKLAQGSDKYMLHWYVNDVAARILDAERVEFRHNLVGEVDAPPAGATNPVRLH
jgi:hypothetical protein